MQHLQYIFHNHLHHTNLLVNLNSLLKAEHYIGRAPEQVEDFLRDVVTPIKRKYRKFARIGDVELKV